MLREKLASRTMKVAMASFIIVAMVFSGISVIFQSDMNADAQILGGEYGGDLRVALKEQPNTFNPLSDTINEPAMQVIDILYDSLGRISPYTYELEPWVASGWEIDEMDDSIITITLKDGVKWHDGTDVTLDDIEYTFGAYGIDYIDTMTQVNSSLIVDLKAPTSKFFSEALVLKLIPDGFTATSSENGCGPFALDSTGSDMTTILAFDDYHNGRVFLDSIIYTYYTEDTNLPENDARRNGMYRAAFDIIKSKVDFLAWDLTSDDTTLMVEVPFGTGNYTNLVQDANVSVQRSNGMSYWYLGMNCNDTGSNPLADPEMRKAIAHTLDKESLTVFDIGGGLEVSNSIVSKYNIPWYNSSMNKYEYDTTEASKILNAAGYYDYDGDGWRDSPDETPFSLTILGPPEADLTPNVMAGIITGWFQSMGLNTELISNTTAIHTVDIEADSFDMFLFTEDRATVDPAFLKEMFHSDGIATNENLQNFAPTIEIVNESQIKKLDSNLTCYLNYTNIVGTPEVKYNDTVITTGYTIDMETGMFTLDASVGVNLTKDWLNISYSYLPFDHLIELADIQMDPEVRETYVKEAQGFVNNVVPAVPLFSFRVNHAYNTTGLIGWVQTLGGINNFWSFINLRNPIMEGGMDISISLPLAVTEDGMLSGEEINLQIKVEDIDGNPLSSADLSFSGEGVFGTPNYDESTGGYTVSFIAPDTETTRTLTIVVNAAKVSYGAGTGSIDVTVKTLNNEFEIEISKEFSSIPSGNTSTINFIVFDKITKNAVVDADITLTVSPAGLGAYLEEYSGVTDAAGEFSIVFGADNVTIDTTFKVTADITGDDYSPAQKSTSINVVKMDTTAPDDGFLGLPAPSLILVILAFAGVALIIRRKKD
ncbi:MAG: ABC transporter substrate-binding protein [Thermoplasmata archaeon]|nr:ABC transporter substrate-binding protein [Thermoplasmata archaeon]